MADSPSRRTRVRPPCPGVVGRGTMDDRRQPGGATIVAAPGGGRRAARLGNPIQIQFRWATRGPRCTRILRTIHRVSIHTHSASHPSYGRSITFQMLAHSPSQTLVAAPQSSCPHRIETPSRSPQLDAPPPLPSPAHAVSPPRFCPSTPDDTREKRVSEDVSG